MREGGRGDRPIGLVILSRQVLLAEALVAVWALQPGLRPVGTAADEESALRLLRRHRPDVVVVDRKVASDWAALVPVLHRTHPGVGVVVLSSVAAPDVVLRAQRAGALGVLVTSVGVRESVAVLERAAGGEPSFPEGVVLDRRSRLPLPGADGLLSAREIEVLSMVARGDTIEAIASELVLSPHTVRNHVKNTLRKLGAHTRAEAVAVAVRRGIVAID